MHFMNCVAFAGRKLGCAMRLAFALHFTAPLFYEKMAMRGQSQWDEIFKIWSIFMLLILRLVKMICCSIFNEFIASSLKVIS